jgi:hypothetical protein
VIAGNFWRGLEWNNNATRTQKVKKLCPVSQSRPSCFFGVYASLVMVVARPHQLLDVGEKCDEERDLKARSFVAILTRRLE